MVEIQTKTDKCLANINILISIIMIFDVWERGPSPTAALFLYSSFFFLLALQLRLLDVLAHQNGGRSELVYNVRTQEGENQWM